LDGFNEKEFSEELPIEKWREIVKQGLKLGVKEWEISGGGEPMAQKKKTLAIIDTIKKNNPTAYCEMITNGLVFDEEDVIKLIKLGMDKIRVSLEGTNPEDHDYMVNKTGAYKRVISTLENFKKLKREHNKNSPAISFNSIFTNILVKNLKELINIAKEYDVSEIELNPLEIFPNTESNMGKFQINSENYQYIEKELTIYGRLANQYNLSLCYDSILNSIVDSELRVGLSDAVVINGEALKYHELRLYKQIRLMKDSGNYDKAIIHIKQELKQDGNNPILLFLWGECLMEKEKYVEAIKLMRKAISIRPQINWVRFSLAKCYYYLNKYEISLKYLNQNLNMCKVPYSHFHSWYLKALNYEKLNDKSKLLFCLEQAKSFKIHFAKNEIPEEIQLLKKYEPRMYLLFKERECKKKSFGQKLDSVMAREDLQLGNFKQESNMEKKEQFIRSLQHALCYEPFYGMVIDMHGRVAPCVVAGKGDEDVDLKRLSLQQIWNGDYLENIRKNSLKGIHRLSCKRCALHSHTKTIKDALKLSLWSLEMDERCTQDESFCHN